MPTDQQFDVKDLLTYHNSMQKLLKSFVKNGKTEDAKYARQEIQDVQKEIKRLRMLKRQSNG